MNLHSSIDSNELSTFLQTHQILSQGESINRLSIPGDGNMNVVLRVETTEDRSLILKQSRPFVQKYQSIPAPVERINVEHTFYQATQNNEISKSFPKVLGFIPEHYFLVLEDLGEGSDMTSLYHTQSFQPNQLQDLVQVACGIHQSVPEEPYPKNMELKKLNHQHIFELPFMEDNGFDLDTIQEGLQALSRPFKTDLTLRKAVHSLGCQYLSEGESLIHGDYYPGSWLEREEKVFVLDPEFSYLGDAEFDIGVLSAHALFIENDSDMLERIVDLYQGPIDPLLVRKYAGVEIIRRIIGLAQLPLKRTIVEKQKILDLAYYWVMG